MDNVHIICIHHKFNNTYLKYQADQNLNKESMLYELHAHELMIMVKIRLLFSKSQYVNFDLMGKFQTLWKIIQEL